MVKEEKMKGKLPSADETLLDKGEGEREGNSKHEGNKSVGRAVNEKNGSCSGSKGRKNP